MFWDSKWLMPRATVDVMEVYPGDSGGFRGYLREGEEVVDASFARVGGGRELSRLVVQNTTVSRTSEAGYSESEIFEILEVLGHDLPVSRMLLVRKRVLETWRYFEILNQKFDLTAERHSLEYRLGPIGSRVSTLDYYLDGGVLG